MSAKSMLFGFLILVTFGIQALAAGRGDHAHGKSENIGHPRQSIQCDPNRQGVDV